MTDHIGRPACRGTRPAADEPRRRRRGRASRNHQTPSHPFRARPRTRGHAVTRHPRAALDRRRGPARRIRVLTDRQGGFATAELAAALPAIVLMLLTGLFAVDAVATQTRCADAAREAVLAQSRGEDGRAAAERRLPPHADVEIASTADTVTAEITAQVRPLGSLLPAMTVTGRATAAREDQQEAP